MKFFNVLWIWICLSGIWISAAVRKDIFGNEGNNISILCSHTLASNNKKYFCRDPCKDEKDTLVRSDQSPKGRYTLKDFGNGTFNVTITDLQLSDSGIYWCAVDRTVLDTYEKVRLTVINEKNINQTTTPNPVASSQPLTTNSSISTASGSANITTSSLTTGFKDPVVSPEPAFNGNSGSLMLAVIILTVIVIIFGSVFCMYYKQKREAHNSNAKIQEKTPTTETGVYEEIAETQQQPDRQTNIIYSTVNKNPTANQIQEPPLYSNLSVQPKTGCTKPQC